MDAVPVDQLFLVRIGEFSPSGTCLISSKRGPVGSAGPLLFPFPLASLLEPVRGKSRGCLSEACLGLQGKLASLWAPERWCRGPLAFGELEQKTLGSGMSESGECESILFPQTAASQPCLCTPSLPSGFPYQAGRKDARPGSVIFLQNPNRMKPKGLCTACSASQSAF